MASSLMFILSCLCVVSVGAQSNIAVHRGDDILLPNPSHMERFNVRWVKDTSVIVEIKGGIRSGLKLNKGFYNITNNGSLTITNAQVWHEGSYEVVTLSEHNIRDEIKYRYNVTVTVKPSTSCPSINICDSCHVCNQIIKKPVNLSCTVTGSRPALKLSWDLQAGSNMSLKQFQQPVEFDDLTNTSTTTIGLLVEPISCESHAHVFCIALDPFSLLKTTEMSVRMYTGQCDIDSTETSKESVAEPRRGWIPGVIIPLITVIVIAIAFVGYWWTRTPTETKPQGPGLETRSSFKEVMRPLLNTEGNLKGKQKNLIFHLKHSYEKFGFLKPLPWGEEIPIDALYTETECSIVHTQGHVTKTSTERLLSGDYIKKEKRVIFIADLGYGKTTFTQHVVHRWLQNDDDVVLIFLRLKDVSGHMSLDSIVMQMIPDDCGLTKLDFERILTKSRCLVLLDGLDELSMSTKDEIVKGDNFTARDKYQFFGTDDEGDSLTIDKLISTSNNINYPNLRVWVTSRDVDDMKSPFTPPYVKVKFLGFSDDQLRKYINKTCRYYSQLSGHTSSDSSNGNTMVTVHDETKVSFRGTKNNDSEGYSGGNYTDDIKSRYQTIDKKVEYYLTSNDIISDFQTTPLLLMMIIHIVTANITNTIGSLRDINITKLSTLIRAIITCLESRYTQKRNDPSLQAKMPELEAMLGQIAIDNGEKVSSFQLEDWKTLIGSENVETALAIGLLRFSKHVGDSDKNLQQLAYTSYTGVTFYHPLIREYLVGQHFPTDKTSSKVLKELIEKNLDNETSRTLQFMCGADHSQTNYILEHLLETGKWNNFIDCLHETANEDKMKRALVKLKQGSKKLGKNPSIQVNYLNRNYHKDAVTSFCRFCRQHKIEIKSMTFQEDCPISVLIGLKLPTIERVELCLMDISRENDFTSILEWFSQQEITKVFQFVKCQLPENLSDQAKEACKKYKVSTAKVARRDKRSQKAISVQTFNFEKGKWRREYFPKKQ